MKVTKNQAKQIRALKRMKDEDIDFSDIPKLSVTKSLSWESFTGQSRGHLENGTGNFILVGRV
ncbi:MAG: hypothetical protein WCG81_10715 [Candidatus Angelobacter sp.]